MPSKRLSAFFGKPRTLAAVVFVPDGAPVAALAVNYEIHGFGDTPEAARAYWERRFAERPGTEPQMLLVFPDANARFGHHLFVNSSVNGPVEEAFTEELIPAVEERFGGVRPGARRFLSGHSSGGWSAIHLQLDQPQLFGGVWAIAPDALDFHAFDGVDLFAQENAYVRADGREVQAVKRAGIWTSTLRAEVAKDRPEYGVYVGFDAAFSPADSDGRVRPLFDRRTGAIDRGAATYWIDHFDLSKRVRRIADRERRALVGRIRIYVGAEDTYGLDEGCRRFGKTLEDLGIPAEIVFVDARDHLSLLAPDEALWPEGLWPRIRRDIMTAAMIAERGRAPERAADLPPSD